MGARGELFTTQVTLDNRSYFFNVKENRNGDIFLQVVESKSRNGEDFDRHAIVVFADDMREFFKGLDTSISFIEKEKKERSKAAAAGKKIYRKPTAEDERRREGVKKTGRVHVVSKRPSTEENQ